MIVRTLGMLLFWFLGIVTAFFATVSVHGFLAGSSIDGYPPLGFAIATATAIPMVYIWRFMIR